MFTLTSFALRPQAPHQLPHVTRAPTSQLSPPPLQFSLLKVLALLSPCLLTAIWLSLLVSSRRISLRPAVVTRSILTRHWEAPSLDHFSTVKRSSTALASRWWLPMRQPQDQMPWLLISPSSSLMVPSPWLLAQPSQALWSISSELGTHKIELNSSLIFTQTLPMSTI